MSSLDKKQFLENFRQEASSWKPKQDVYIATVSHIELYASLPGALLNQNVLNFLLEKIF